MSQCIHKLRIPVRLSRPAQEALDGFLLLSPQEHDDDRLETALDLLNSARTVIPFISPSEGSVLLLMRANIDWVAVGSSVDTRLIYPPNRSVTREQRVELHFMDGSHIDGIIQWDDAENLKRLSDFLSWCDDFFVVVATSATLIVNKQRIRETRVAESTPRPAQVRVTAG